MIAINEYKDMINEVGRMLSIFANYDGSMNSLTLQSWTIGTIHNTQAKVMKYAGVAVTNIKDELIGDCKEAEYRGRLRTAFFELNEVPNFAPSYFPVFDEAFFELPSRDNPKRNRQMLDAFIAIYGSERNAADVMASLQTTAQWANVIVGDVSKMLDDVCRFVGYTPERQEQPEQQPPKKDLHYYCLKAIEKGYLVKADVGYRLGNWKKAQLAYFLKHFLNTDGTFPDKEYSVMFGESRLSKAADQLSINKNGDGKPRGYEIVDELLQE